MLREEGALAGLDLVKVSRYRRNESLVEVS